MSAEGPPGTPSPASHVSSSSSAAAATAAPLLSVEDLTVLLPAGGRRVLAVVVGGVLGVLVLVKLLDAAQRRLESRDARQLLRRQSHMSIE